MRTFDHHKDLSRSRTESNSRKASLVQTAASRGKDPSDTVVGPDPKTCFRGLFNVSFTVHTGEETRLTSVATCIVDGDSESAVYIASLEVLSA